MILPRFFILSSALNLRDHFCPAAIVAENVNTVPTEEAHLHMVPIDDEIVAPVTTLGQPGVIQRHLHSVPLIHGGEYTPPLYFVKPLRPARGGSTPSTTHPSPLSERCRPECQSLQCDSVGSRARRPGHSKTLHHRAVV